MDDLLILKERGQSKVIENRKDWLKKRRIIKDAVLSLIGKPPCKKCPLQPAIMEEKNMGSYVRRKVSFLVEKNERVNAYLLIPKKIKGALPAVLCLHGTRNRGKDELMKISGVEHHGRYDYAMDLARRGFITLSPDHICAGERIEPGYEPYDTTPFYKKYPNWSAVGKAVWDNMRALDYLCSLKFVDPKQLGCMGLSLGGHSSVFLAAFDKRVKASCSVCGITVFEKDKNRLNWARDRGYTYIPKLRPIFLKNQKPPFEIHELIALIAPRAFLSISAFNDTCWSAEADDAVAGLGVQVNKAYRLLGKEQNFSNYLNGQGHTFSWDAKAIAYAWFDNMLAN